MANEEKRKTLAEAIKEFFEQLVEFFRNMRKTQGMALISHEMEAIKDCVETIAFASVEEQEEIEAIAQGLKELNKRFDEGFETEEIAEAFKKFVGNDIAGLNEKLGKNKESVESKLISFAQKMIGDYWEDESKVSFETHWMADESVEPVFERTILCAIKDGKTVGAIYVDSDVTKGSVVKDATGKFLQHFDEKKMDSTTSVDGYDLGVFKGINERKKGDFSHLYHSEIGTEQVEEYGKSYTDIEVNSVESLVNEVSNVHTNQYIDSMCKKFGLSKEQKDILLKLAFMDKAKVEKAMAYNEEHDLMEQEDSKESEGIEER